MMKNKEKGAELVKTALKMGGNGTLKSETGKKGAPMHREQP